MGDLIARDDVLSEINKLDEDVHFGFEKRVLHALYLHICHIPVVNIWISIKDKIPKPNKKYLTYAETTKYCNHPEIYEDGRINVLYYNGEEWYDEECAAYNVTHWMQLPEKPESGVKYE